MTERNRKRPRWTVLTLAVLLHIAALAGLVRVFAPDFAASVVSAATSLVAVDLSEPLPDPPTEPSPREDEGAAAESGREATPREIAAPEAPLPRPAPIPPAAATGAAVASGASAEGAGSGGGGTSFGAGSGRSGSGQGGMAATRPEKIAGDINDARDYPIPPGGRQLRRGHEVIVQMTVGVDGRARECRVIAPSPDPEADRITCRLAEERFRFRPARDAAGNPVPAQYGWRQRWF